MAETDSIKANAVMEQEKEVIGEEEYYRFIKPYEEAMEFLMVQIKILNNDYRDKYKNYPIHNVQSRIKSKESIIGKLKRKELKEDFITAKDYLMDIAGIRIICYFKDDVYQIVDRFKKYSDIVWIKERDYIGTPKPNGYRSYHMVLGVPVYHTDSKEYYPVEIQIRTLTMDLWASMEHRILYKGGDIEREKAGWIFKRFALQLKENEEELYQILKNNF